MFTIALTIVKTFFSGLITKVMKAVDWLMEHPAVLVAIVALVGGYVLGSQRTASRLTAAHTKELRAYKDDLENQRVLALARQKKVQEIETSTKAAAETLVKERSAIETRLAQVTKDYEAKLKSERAKPPRTNTVYVEVEVPGSKDKVEVKVQDGEVVCRRFEDTFTETVNKMLEAK